jgi:hypothetical protein
MTRSGQDHAKGAARPRPRGRGGVCAAGLYVLLACAVLLCSRARPEEPRPTPSPPATASGADKDAPKAQGSFYLLTDYIPPALYEGEPLTACLRVENLTGKPEELELRAEMRDAAGQVMRVERSKVFSPASGFAPHQGDYDLAGVRSVRFVLGTPVGEAGGPEVRVLREDEPWPATRTFRSQLLEAASSAVLLPTVRRRLKTENRSWASVRWMLGRPEQAVGEPAKTGWLFLPGAWDSGRGEAAPALVPDKLRAAKAWTRLGPYPLEGVAPILRVVGDVLNGLPQPAPEAVVLLLPPEDLEAATAPRLYGLAVELLLVRLVAAGARQVTLAPPFGYGRPEGRQKALWDAVLEATQAHPARGVSVTEFLDESLWRLDPQVGGVYGQRPNAAGQKKIAQALANLLP